jgi:hypothetical protein
MRYLVVFALLFVGCGVEDASDFSEPILCFEDGTEGKLSNVQAPSEDADSPLGPAETLEPNAKDARPPCIVTEYWDLTAGPGCIYYDCQNCIKEDILHRADAIFCGHTICLPYNSGWVNPGYPLPFKAESENNVQ